MRHPLLLSQLEQLGITGAALPDLHTWQQFLEMVSSAYDETHRRAGLPETSDLDYRQFFENAHDAILIFEPENEIVVELNRRACDFYGYSREEFLGQSLEMVSTFEIPQRCKDGSVIIVEINATVIEFRGRSAILTINRDVTERARAEQALRESEQRYRQQLLTLVRQAQAMTLLNQVREAVAQSLDLPAVIRTVVEAIAETFGYTLVSLYLLEGGTLVLQHQVGYHQVISHIPITRGVAGRVVRTGMPVWLEDVRTDPDFLRAIEGIVSEICIPLFDRDRVVGMFNVESTAGKALSEADLRLMMALGEHVSIAIERGRLYTAVRESKERYQSVVETVNDAIFQTDVDGLPLITGEKESCRHEIRYLTSGGGFCWIEVHGVRTVAANGLLLGTSGTLTDITERKRVEQQALELALFCGKSWRRRESVTCAISTRLRRRSRIWARWSKTCSKCRGSTTMRRNSSSRGLT